MHHENNAAISPYIEGEFTPFIFYLQVSGYEIASERRSGSTFNWLTDENGWIPGFFNASFDWFSSLKVTTNFSYPLRLFNIKKKVSREVVW